MLFYFFVPFKSIKLTVRKDMIGSFILCKGLSLGLRLNVLIIVLLINRARRVYFFSFAILCQGKTNDEIETSW